MAGLAVVQALTPAELEQEVKAAGGDVEIDSPQAEVILARFEKHFGCKLPAVSDLDPEQFTSIEALVELVERRLAVNLPSPILSQANRDGADVRVA